VDAAELRAGQRVLVGVLFEMDPGWHIYWRNSGESGLPTELAWSSDQAEVGPILWPAPKVFRESDGFLTTYGYADRVLLASEARVARTAGGSLRLEVVADFVVCEVGCIPGHIELRQQLPVTRAGSPASSDVNELFRRHLAQLPKPPEELAVAVDVRYSQSAIRPGDDFQAVVSVRSCAAESNGCDGYVLAARRAYEAFVPERLPSVELAVRGRTPDSDGSFSLILSGRTSADDPAVDMQRLRGLIPLRGPRGERTILDVDLPLPRAALDTAISPVASPLFEVRGGFAVSTVGVSLAQAFALALLGGLILNLMPCVLPILAIKVFHVAELAHESRRRVLAHAAAYTIGVLASMLVMATLVTALRLAGTAVGWGFQFQEPMFLAAMCTLLVVFSLNLFGVFEVTLQPSGLARAAQGASPLRRSFFEGLLVVVLATPCTAPFLGTAVGFAFASSPPVVFAIFLAIGLGLAAPYAAVSLVPGWARIIPRPGAWMIHVRRLLGFSLVATVVWLLWVVGRSLGVDAQALLLGYLVAVAFLTWAFGSLQASGATRLASGFGLASLAVALVALAGLPLAAPERGSRVAASSPSASRLVAEAAADESWRPYDIAAIEAELGLGRPVFVDFTADWCLTCKVNESVVLADERVLSELERLKVATFTADWTLYDDEIRQVLASFGKAGVPLYLVYGPAAPHEPEVLPELLTVDMMIEALRDAAGSDGV
jgi:thiol:disulfide interchange protein DsbD